MHAPLVQYVRVLAMCCGLALSTTAGAAPIVVETPALSPQQQRAKFKLPPGFDIQLIAAEPDIGKPMNLNFDARGRLWLTHSLEYPFPTAGEGVQPRDLKEDQITIHAPRDRLSYFESIGPDGLGRGLTHFADGLNIPIGQLPLVWSNDQTAALAYSIPSLRLYESGRPPRVLFTGFGNVDTHGMCNSFTRGFDGWVYACHGFRNTSKITTPDGKERLVLNSGNTLRFSPDGFDVEQFTRGQVNPFGMTFDNWGNLYNADCHSMPVTLLLKGAVYQSFGKPDDGLGFGPDMIDHNHGSTGICGVAWYDAPQFPDEFRDCLYICNPVNGQVHRDRLKWTGSSPKVETQPELITCDDGWFRPVDVKLGPDGALYIADFYNAIIGHYEAPLQHPRRDRSHARLWRVVYRGTDASAPPATAPDLTEVDDAQLINSLANPNFTVRMLATNLLVDRIRPPTERSETDEKRRAVVLDLLEFVIRQSVNADQAVHAAWAWARLIPSIGLADEPTLARLVTHHEPMVRTHAGRIIGHAHRKGRAEFMSTQLTTLLRDPDPRVRRAAVEAAADMSHAPELTELLTVSEQAAPGDTHLRHAARIALREALEQQGLPVASIRALPKDRQRILAGVMPGVSAPSLELTRWLSSVVVAEAGADSSVPRGEWRSWIKSFLTHLPSEEANSLIAVIQAAGGDDLSEQVENARACLAGLSTGPHPGTLIEWAERLAMQCIADAARSRRRWSSRPLPGEPSEPSPFGLERRTLEGTRDRSLLISSLPGGETRTGIHRSPMFRLPASFSFRLCGHNGWPNQPDRRENVVRLVDARTGEVLREAWPPRNDAARLVTWDLSELAGREAVIELVDGCRETAYAWLAAGDFSVTELSPSTFDSSTAAVALVKDFRLQRLKSRLAALLMADDRSLRSLAAGALLALEPDSRATAVLLWSQDADLPPNLDDRLWMAIRSRDAGELSTLLSDLLAGARSERQQKVADALVTDRPGAELLVELASQGRLSARLLQSPVMRFKLALFRSSELDARVEQLIGQLPPVDEQVATLIAARRKAFNSGEHSADGGRLVFTKRCAVCHQIGSEGAKVGPQLDGIGIRGLDRLLEDILDPNRNIDAAFRSSVIALQDGRVLTGLKRREEGAEIVFANSEGKEFRVPSVEIEELKLSPVSLMPANLGEAIPENELTDLMAWLLTQRPAK